MAVNRGPTKNMNMFTALTDSVIMAGVIDAHKRRNIAIIDVENAF